MMWSFVFIKSGDSTDLGNAGSFTEQRLVIEPARRSAMIFLIFIIPGGKLLYRYNVHKPLFSRIFIPSLKKGKNQESTGRNRKTADLTGQGVGNSSFG